MMMWRPWIRRRNSEPGDAGLVRIDPHDRSATRCKVAGQHAATAPDVQGLSCGCQIEQQIVVVDVAIPEWSVPRGNEAGLVGQNDQLGAVSGADL